MENEQKPTRRAKKTEKMFMSGTLILGAVIACFFGMKRMRNAYELTNQNAYDEIYQTAYDSAESRNHVSNYTLVSVEGSREISRLEVLNVTGSEFVIKNADENDKIISWVEVKGSGVFTVDLSISEFIVDSEREYVLARVPNPALTECKVNEIGKQFLKNGSVISNGSVADGFRLSQAQRSEGRTKLEDSIRQSRRFNEAAKEATVRMIKSLVQQWNPNVPNLQVEVEFVESN